MDHLLVVLPILYFVSAELAALRRRLWLATDGGRPFKHCHTLGA